MFDMGVYTVYFDRSVFEGRLFARLLKLSRLTFAEYRRSNSKQPYESCINLETKKLYWLVT